MAGLDDTIRAILSGAPDLLQSPGLAAGLAQGAQPGADHRATAMSAALAAILVGHKDGLADLNGESQ